MARPRVPLETGVEEAGRILQRRTLGEGHLHDLLVGLARADDAVVLPRRDAAPLPLLDDVGIGLLDHLAEPAEHLAPPVVELLDPRVDLLRRRLALLRRACGPLFFIAAKSTRRSARSAQLPDHRMLGVIGAERSRAHGVREVAAERLVLRGDPAQAVLDPVGHGFAHALGRITGRPGPAGQPVRTRELVGDRLDLDLGTRRALRVVPFASFRQVAFQLRDRDLGTRVQLRRRSRRRSARSVPPHQHHRPRDRSRGSPDRAGTAGAPGSAAPSRRAGGPSRPRTTAPTRRRPVGTRCRRPRIGQWRRRGRSRRKALR